MIIKGGRAGQRVEAARRDRHDCVTDRQHRRSEPGAVDLDTEMWVRSLSAEGNERDDAVARLHVMLLRIARSELGRRAVVLDVEGPELDDIAHQAAGDALMAICAKVGQFRRESRFTTWAYKFVIFEVSGKVSRHHWRRVGRATHEVDWERFPERMGLQPEHQAEWRDLVAAVRRAVEQVLTDKQRHVFVAIVVNGMPLDALAAELGSSRNAIYKVMFDARRKIRATLVADGYVRDDDTSAHESGRTR